MKFSCVCDEYNLLQLYWDSNYGYYTHEIECWFKAISLITFLMWNETVAIWQHCPLVSEVSKSGSLWVPAGPCPTDLLSSGLLTHFSQNTAPCSEWFPMAVNQDPQAWWLRISYDWLGQFPPFLLCEHMCKHSETTTGFYSRSQIVCCGFYNRKWFYSHLHPSGNHTL